MQELANTGRMVETAIPAMASSMIVFHVLATVCMCLRFYSKRKTKTKYFLDDWVLMVCWVFSTAYIVIALYDTQYGLGFHTTDMKTLGQPVYWALFKKNHVLQLPLLFIGITICWVSKLSFFITLLRLVRNKTQKKVLWVAMTASSLFLFALSIIQPFAQCQSIIVQLLNHGEAYLNCVPHNITVPMTLAAYCFAALTDFGLATVPTLVVWKLQMKKQQKIAVICAMSTGCFAGVVAIFKVIKTYETFFLGTQDLYTAGLGIALNSVEVSCTVVGASIPFIRLLVPKFNFRKEKKQPEPDVIAMSPLQDQEPEKKKRVKSWYGVAAGELSNGFGSSAAVESRSDFYSKDSKTGESTVAIVEVDRV
ncbi:hypothetical protein B0T20DRAFT_414909 [Sordaria brevicollis]|uniref:Rhodopsin domain-containing protein n=1 Tax=Sordaria brevicollis TaxID=83679 RepID=A0AAE0PBL6_SORBR|nr:hypothetical protein B0T20DRAFT_414909 [Sordaria brevicollis]